MESPLVSITIIAEGIAQENGSVSFQARYVCGHVLIYHQDDQDDKASYLHNGHGDVVELRDENGSLLNRYTYDILGNLLTKEETVPNPFLLSYTQGSYGMKPEDCNILEQGGMIRV